MLGLVEFTNFDFIIGEFVYKENNFNVDSINAEKVVIVNKLNGNINITQSILISTANDFLKVIKEANDETKNELLLKFLENYRDNPSINDKDRLRAQKIIKDIQSIDPSDVENFFNVPNKYKSLKLKLGWLIIGIAAGTTLQKFWERFVNKKSIIDNDRIDFEIYSEKIDNEEEIIKLKIDSSIITLEKREGTYYGIDPKTIKVEVLKGDPSLLHIYWSDYPQGSGGYCGTFYIICCFFRPYEVLLRDWALAHARAGMMTGKIGKHIVEYNGSILKIIEHIQHYESDEPDEIKTTIYEVVGDNLIRLETVETSHRDEVDEPTKANELLRKNRSKYPVSRRGLIRRILYSFFLDKFI